MSRQIPLYRRRKGGPEVVGYAQVDDEDHDRLAKHKWYLRKDGYAGRNEHPDGKTKTILLHRAVLDAPAGMQVDHIDGDKLNNRRSNLRLVTPAQNQYNRRPSDGSSRYKGVSWHKRHTRWTAYIKIDGKQHYLGFFENEIDAAVAYDMAALEHFGEYARPNVLPNILLGQPSLPLAAD